MEYQKTLKSSITHKGVGLHSGEKVEITIKPAQPDYGICFQHVDFPSSLITARLDNVQGTKKCTTLGNKETSIKTVEHLLAAFYALGVDNALIEVKGSEIPAADGSAGEFVRIIQDSGIISQDLPKKITTLQNDCFFSQQDSFIMAFPDDKLKFTVVSFYPSVGFQYFSTELTADIFIKEIAMARTFGFKDEVEKLYQEKLALGGSLDNALIIGPSGYLNPPRFSNEIVRHKMLDLIGDLSLVGCRLTGHYIAFKTSHTLNFNFAKKLKEVMINGYQ